VFDNPLLIFLKLAEPQLLRIAMLFRCGGPNFFFDNRILVMFSVLTRDYERIYFTLRAVKTVRAEPVEIIRESDDSLTSEDDKDKVLP
jgi:hypothetical protein